MTQAQAGQQAKQRYQAKVDSWIKLKEAKAAYQKRRKNANDRELRAEKKLARQQFGQL